MVSDVSSLQGEFSHLVLLAAFDCIDDTKLVKQLILSVSNFFFPKIVYLVASVCLSVYRRTRVGIHLLSQTI